MPPMTSVDYQPPTRSWLDRTLSVFADVRAGEGRTPC